MDRVTETLLGGQSLDEFMKRDWGERVRLIRQGGKKLEGCVTEEEVMDLVEKGHHWMTRMGRGTGGYFSAVQFDGGVREAVQFGSALQVFNVEKVRPELQLWYEEVLSILNAEGTTLEGHYGNAGSGLNWHSDKCGFFTIQLKGRKKWEVARRRTDPLPSGNLVLEKSPAEIESFDLEPFDVLYVPPHFAHQTEALSESLSFSLPVKSE